MPPSVKNGKICYVELPTVDVAVSAKFYSDIFGWNMRTRANGATAFDDSVGQVSGGFVPSRAASSGAPGLLVYIMVDDIAATCKAVEERGGTIVQPLGVDAPELTARFRDPAGNLLGLYQEPIQRG